MKSFVEQLARELSKPLSENAQWEMAPEFRQKPKKEWIEAQNPRLASVLLLMYPKEEQLHISFTKRHEYEGVHSKQISLPGGKHESFDNDLLSTALRETEEEIGAKPDQIVGQLSEIYIPPSNFLVQPYVGFCNQVPSFQLEEREVAELLEIPLLDLQHPHTATSVNLHVRGRDITVPAYVWNEEIIWGATAMILAEFLAYTKQC